jgi:CheY-like chemotaxis protein
MKTLLIADDEEHLRLLVTTTLAGPDYRILEARDGDEALDLAQRQHPDLIILDWMMPQRTGIEVLRALREDPTTTAIPVILLTAKAQKTDRNQALLLGIRGYLIKPFSPLELIELVDKVLSTGTLT